MPTLRRARPRSLDAARGAGNRPVLLATLDVPFVAAAIAFAVDAAVESGQSLLVVNVVQIALAPASLAGYGYIEEAGLQQALREPADLAHSLAVQVERLRLCSPHPIDALLQLMAEREPGVLVFGPDRASLKPRTYRRAARRISARATCLVWLEDDP
jgi:nucleotide-binding universal stress UspA family protein